MTKTDLEEMQERLGRSDTYPATEHGGDMDVRQQLSRDSDFQGTSAPKRKRAGEEFATANTKRHHFRDVVTPQQLAGHASWY